MVVCKCLEKIYNKNGIITSYNLMDTNGNVKELSKDAVKQYIKSGELLITNLMLSKDGKLVNRSVEEEAKLMQKLKNTKLSHSDQKMETKSEIIGSLACADERGRLITKGIDKDLKTLTISKDIKYINGLVVPNHDIFFIGNSEVVIQSRIICNKATIRNQTMYNSLLAAKIQTEDCVYLSTDDLNEKSLDFVFKYIKTVTQEISPKWALMVINSKNMDKSKALEKMRSILKRQKPSSKADRRCYDLLVYIAFMYCMAVSFGDITFIDGINAYKKEFSSKYRQCELAFNYIYTINSFFTSQVEQRLIDKLHDMGINADLEVLKR